MKLHNVFIILTLSFLLISAAYASDNNTQDDVNTIEKTEKISNLDDVTIYNQDTPSVEKYTRPNKSENLTTPKDEYPQKPVEIQYEDGINRTGDCSTVILQISEYESVLSFRRDSTGSSLNIYVSNNSSFIKQYKTSGSYFFHVLVSKDGWMVGTGGADNARINSLIEARAINMIKNNKITTSDLNYVASLHRQIGLGHFIIKAPDGRYGSEVYRSGSMINTGILKSGDYIICPNSKYYYRKGNCANDLRNYDPVYESRLLTLKDPYGEKRRNIMTYHFRRNETTSHIDFYAGNDNGAYVGRKTAYLRDNIVTSTKTVGASSLPTNVGGMYIQTYTYIVNASYKPNVNFVVTTNPTVTKMGCNLTLIARLNIDDKAVNKGYVIFKINGITLKDVSNQTLRAYLKNGVTSINYVIPDGWSAKPFKLTAVYSRINYGRIENKTYFNLSRPDIHMQLNNITSNSRAIHITGRLLDEHNHNVKGDNIFAVKVSGLTLKQNNKVLLFKVTNGIIDIHLVLPEYYKNANHTIVLSTGTRGAYNAARGSCNLNLVI